jgi:hypothetical protein
VVPGAGLRIRQTSILPRVEREEHSPSAAPSREDKEAGPDRVIARLSSNSKIITRVHLFGNRIPTETEVQHEKVHYMLKTTEKRPRALLNRAAKLLL